MEEGDVEGYAVNCSGWKEGESAIAAALKYIAFGSHRAD